jgi:hypothetical protein
MRSLCIAAVVAAAIASPASAQSARKAQTQRALPATSHDVYSGGRWLGRDPDPNVRFEILRTQNWRKG